MSRPIRNLAILVGINAYEHEISPLKTPVNDASSLAKILEGAYNYDVRKLLDTEATLQGFHSLMEDLKQGILTLSDNRTVRIEAYDQVLFYFAGHGIAFGGFDSSEGPQGYLIPQDAGNNDKSTFLPMQQLHDVLVELECLHLLVILDCCFAGAFRYSRNLVPYQKLYRERYERFMQGKAQQTLFSAAHDERALDVLTRLGIREENRTQENSPFAQVLLQALKADGDVIPDGVMTATELYVYLDDELAKLTDRQTPGLSLLKHHEKGQYIFEVPDFNPDRLEQAPPLDESTNPYRGLQPYEPEHSELFFGRENAIADLVEQVKQTGELPLTVVVGASGCGKSSLVKAGLIPRLQQEQWQVIEPMSPGRTPFKSLARAILPETANQEQIDGFSHKLRQAPSSLMEQVNSSKASGKVLLAIDQLEELVTLCSSEQRKQFLDWLKRLLATNSEQLHIIMTVRSDFEPQFAEAVWQKSQWMAARFMVSPMTLDELRDVIEKPASEKVLFFEPPELVDRLIDDVVQMPGALPLLSFTLSELYLKYLERRSDNRAMTRDDYEQLGGVIGALTQRATEVYQSLVNQDSAYEQTIRHVMLRMVAMSGGELTRRRVAEVELEYPEPEDQRVKQVVQRFVNARLLVRGTNSEGQPYVEPAHDALVLGWEKLLEWKQEEEEDLILQRRLTPAALEWKDEQSSKFLWNANPRLDLLKQVSKSEDNWFNQTEAEFVQRSVRKRRKNIATRWGIAVAVMLGLGGLTVAALIGQRDTLIGQIRTARQASEANLPSNPVNGLIYSVRAGQSLKHRLLQLFQPDQTLNNQVRGTLQQSVYQVKEYNRFKTHSGRVNSVSFSPDGTLIATASADGTAIVWDKQGNQQARLSHSHEEVISVSFSPDGNLIATACADGTAKLWNLQGDRVGDGEFKHSKGLTYVSFSPNGNLLATASYDDTAKLWNLQGKQLASFEHPESDWVTSISFSPDGNLLATASRDGVKLWNLQGKEQDSFQDSDWVTSVSFSPDGNRLATASSDGTVKLWNLQGKEQASFKHSHGITSISFSPDGNRLATASQDATAMLWDLQGNQQASFRHSSWLSDVSFSPDGKLLATASHDRTAKLWYTSGEPHPTFEPIKDIMSVSFSPTGELVATISDQGTVQLWDSQGNQHLAFTPVEGINSVSFSPTGEQLATVSDNGKAQLWDLQGNQQAILENSDAIISINFSPDGKLIATVSDNNTAQLWDVQGNHHDSFFEVNTIYFSPDSQLLATVYAHNQIIKLWDLQGDQQAVFENVLSISFSPTGKLLATVSGDNDVQLWDRQGNRQDSFESSGSIESVHFSPDGKLLAMVSDDGVAQLRDLRGNLKATFKSSQMTSVSFSPDGRYLATGEWWNGMAKVWDLQGNQVAQFQDSVPVTNVSFSPDGHYLVTAYFDSTTKIWKIESLDELLVKACDRARHYLQNHPTVEQSDRDFCDQVGSLAL